MEYKYSKKYLPHHPNSSLKGYVHSHVLAASNALGKAIPSGSVIHHHSEDQLVLCENHQYHMLLHQRQRALNACGCATYRKCWICQGWDNPDNLTFTSKGRKIAHKHCRNEYARLVAQAKRFK